MKTFYCIIFGFWLVSSTYLLWQKRKIRKLKKEIADLEMSIDISGREIGVKEKPNE